MEPPETFDELITRADELDLYGNLIFQLNKDLKLANVDLGFDVEIIPTSLKYLLHDKIYDLIQNKFSVYLNLLYIIDVSEEKIRELDDSDVSLLAENVSLLILQREFRKVWYKHTH